MGMLSGLGSRAAAHSGVLKPAVSKAIPHARGLAMRAGKHGKSVEAAAQLARGRKRLMYGAGAVGGLGAMRATSRSSGSQGLNPKTSGANQDPYGLNY